MSNINPRLNVASSPHWRDGSSISRTQQFWLTALIPAIAASLYLFGLNSLRILGLAVATSVILEYAVIRIIPSRDAVWNWNSVAYAVILAFFMPVNAPWWLVVVGCAIMILGGKRLFGGLGAYPVHPVALSYTILLVSWPSHFDYTGALISFDWDTNMIEPMRQIKTLGTGAESTFDWQALFLGHQAAGIGNGLIMYLLIGGLLLLLLRQIRWHIPVSFLLGVVLTSAVLRFAAPTSVATPLFQLLSGSIIFGAFFIATDFTTSPVHPIPMLIYGFLGGMIVVLIRSFGADIDGVVFAILLINLCTPLLDRIAPKVHGVEGTSHA